MLEAGSNPELASHAHDVLLQLEAGCFREPAATPSILES